MMTVRNGGNVCSVMMSLSYFQRLVVLIFMVMSIQSNNPNRLLGGRSNGAGSSTVTVATAETTTTTTTHKKERIIDDEFKKNYMYLSEPDLDTIYPLIEYEKNREKDGVEPDFLYNKEYPYPRLVEFYAPWCPHCQHFKTQYINFAKSMDVAIKNLNIPEIPKFEIYAVSCVANREICTNFAIRRYPSFRLYNANSLDAIDIASDTLHPFTILQKLNISQSSILKEEEEEEEEVIPKEEGNNNNNNKLRKKGKQQQQQQKDESSSSSIVPYFMDRSKRQLYNDIHLSFDFAMRTAIYTVSLGPLDDKPKNVLKKWLNLLSKTLHPSISLQPIIKDLLDHFDSDVIVSDQKLVAIMDKYPLPTKTWSPACLQHGTGYTCGLWQLLHIVTIGVIEWNELTITSSNKKDDEVSENLLVPMKVGEIIRDYIEEFFLCNDCRMHFLQEYDACEFDRCNRLMNHKTNNKDDWIQLPLWLYEVHNAVNTRLRHERIERNEETEITTNHNDVIWPSKDQCASCWISNDQWDENLVYQYMRLTFWPDDAKSIEIKNLLWKNDVERRTKEEEEAEVEKATTSEEKFLHKKLYFDKMNNKKKEIYNSLVSKYNKINNKNNNNDDDDDDENNDNLLLLLVPVMVLLLGLVFCINLHRKRKYDKKGLHKKL